MSATPTTKPKLFCFVLMPFDTAFDDVYKIGIKESCEIAGAYCERVDEQIFNERILDRIYNQIAKADVVIADMTGRNPNVFYEVGYAHALGKTTILLTSKSDDIPFDLKHFSHIVYGNSLSDLRTLLTKRVKWVVENPPTDGKISLKEDVSIFVGNKNLAEGSSTFEWAGGNSELQIILHNISSQTIEAGSLKIGFITAKDSKLESFERGMKRIKLPDDRSLRMFPDLPALLPDEHTKVGLSFYYQPNVQIDEEKIVLRLLTVRGSREFDLVLKNKSKVQTSSIASEMP
jgi:nucleoside 2-deoxyribosyltransferase